MRDPGIRPRRFGQLDAAFHLRIARAAGGLRGSLLSGLTDPITARMDAALTGVDDWPRTARALADEHEHLADLIGHHRGAEAADFVARHVEQFYADRRGPDREAADDVR
jgi:GntR family transcriptional regulator, transcriptional repressor for pyruvate dehydrogenase complex